MALRSTRTTRSKDLVGVIVFLILFCAVIFFAPEMGGYFLEHANFEPANLLKTPPHIAPVWYFTPFYAILRAVPSKGWGALLMGVAVASCSCLPWLDRCKVKSIRYRGLLVQVRPGRVRDQLRGARLSRAAAGHAARHDLAARFFAVLYFAFFLLMPLYTRQRQDQAGAGRVIYHGH